jgi:Mor family transcriptional regulator
MREYSRTEIEAVIEEWIVGKNAQRNRSILKSRLIDGLTFEELSEKYDMSVRQIQNIVYKTQEKVFKHL